MYIYICIYNIIYIYIYVYIVEAEIGNRIMERPRIQDLVQFPQMIAIGLSALRNQNIPYCMVGFDLSVLY